MLAPVKWLKDYVEFDVDAKTLGDKLTLTGTKTEVVTDLAKEIENVIVGKIIDIRKHDNADKLQILKVDIGKEDYLQIVTSTKNIHVGDLVPVALDNAHLPNNIEIVKEDFRGVVSNGMLCSSRELGIPWKYIEEKARNGIWILDEDAKIGEKIEKVVGLDDSVIEFEITSNRPDCLSMLGIAREVSATLDTPLKKVDKEFKGIDEKFDFSVKVDSSAKNEVKRYMARKIKNVKITSSPLYMRMRLSKAQIRPINNIVDLTNYIMLEYGQPMHAYDLDRINSNEIVVKNAKDGDEFVTLDGEKRTLDSTMAMITNGKDNIGIAGVMGGFSTQVTNDTKNILIESATFEKDNIRETSKKLQLRTDASQRFEKFVDENRAKDAIDRFCYFIEKFGWGEVVNDTKDILDKPLEKEELTVNVKKMVDKIGNDIPKEEIIKILEKLFFEVEDLGEDLKIKVPFYRNDIKMRDDVIEEITRIYGFDKIVSKNIQGGMSFGEISPKRRFEKETKKILAANGLTEVVNYSFIGDKDLEMINFKETNLLRIINPLGKDTEIMRTTLVPSMMNVVKRNYTRKNDFFAGFEIGHIFEKVSNEEPVQKTSLVGAFYSGEEDILSMGKKIQGVVDFYVLKSVLQGVFNGINIKNIRYEVETENLLFHTGRCAKIMKENQILGYIGEIHPKVLENYEIQKRVYMFVLDFDLMFDLRDAEKIAENISKFPAVKRDIAFVVDKSVLCLDIENLIKANSSDIVESIELFDIYEGEQVEDNKKSMAYSITFRAKDRTLKDEEVNKVQDKIVSKLEENLGAHLRDY